jgi:hypothetical protein
VADSSELMDRDADGKRAAAATPKIRSRRDGAAVPMDDVDRRLLKLMQGG